MYLEFKFDKHLDILCAKDQLNLASMDKMNLITNKHTINTYAIEETDQNNNNDKAIKHKVTTVEIDEIRNRS